MLTVRLLTLLCLASFGFAVAAEGIYDGGSGGAKPAGLSDATTNRLVRKLEKGIRLCQSLDPVYRYDCYRQNYREAADRLEGNAAYAVPLTVLRDIEATLQTIVTRHGDAGAPVTRRRGETFRAITPAATARAKETFRRSLDESVTVLLRAADGTGSHFARIARALDSDKILLRASLSPRQRLRAGQALTVALTLNSSKHSSARAAYIIAGPPPI